MKQNNVLVKNEPVSTNSKICGEILMLKLQPSHPTHRRGLTPVGVANV